MAKKNEILENIGAKVAVTDMDGAAKVQGFIVAERKNDFVVAVQKVLDAELVKHVTYHPSVKSVETLKQWLADGVALDECVCANLNEHLFEYRHFAKSLFEFSIIDAVENKPAIYSPVNCFNDNFNTIVGFFGCSEAALPALDRIIVTTIGSENVYYTWHGMHFVSKKYMIQNADDLKVGIARIETKADGQHVIQDEKDCIVNYEQWFKQYCAESAQVA